MAQVPGLQHADHHVQRGHLAPVVKSSGCVLCSARPGEMLLDSHFREKGTDSQKCGPPSWPGMSPEVLTMMPPRSLQSPCQDHTGLHLPLLPSSLHTLPPAPQAPCLCPLYAGPWLQFPAVAASLQTSVCRTQPLGPHIPSLTTPVPLKSPPPPPPPRSDTGATESRVLRREG